MKSLKDLGDVLFAYKCEKCDLNIWIRSVDQDNDLGKPNLINEYGLFCPNCGKRSALADEQEDIGTDQEVAHIEAVRACQAANGDLPELLNDSPLLATARLVCLQPNNAFMIPQLLEVIDALRAFIRLRRAADIIIKRSWDKV